MEAKEACTPSAKSEVAQIKVGGGGDPENPVVVAVQYSLRGARSGWGRGGKNVVNLGGSVIMLLMMYKEHALLDLVYCICLEPNQTCRWHAVGWYRHSEGGLNSRAMVMPKNFPHLMLVAEPML